MFRIKFFIIITSAILIFNSVEAQFVLIDSVKIDSKPWIFKLMVLGNNKFSLLKKQNPQDTIGLKDTISAIGLDSAFNEIKMSLLKNVPQKNKDENTNHAEPLLILYLINTQFEMSEMRNLMMNLSELGLKINIELPQIGKN